MVGSIKVRAAHEVMAAGAAELALLVVQLVSALRTPAPVFALRAVGGNGALGGSGLRLRLGNFFR